MDASDIAKVQRKIRNWTTEGSTKGPCRMLELRYKGSNDASAPVKAWSIVPGMTVESLTKEITDDAQDDADNIGDPHTVYILFPYFGQSERPGGRYPFRVVANLIDKMEGEPEVSEPRNAKGMLSMQMRHNENLHKGSMGHSIDLHRILRMENESLRTEVADYKKDYMDLLRSFKQMYVDKEQHEANMVKIRAKAEFYAGIMEQAKIFAPVVVNRLAGVPLLPESTTPMAEMFRQWFKTLTEDQLAKLGSILSPQQMIPILETMKAFMDQEDKKQEAESKKLTSLAPLNGQAPTPVLAPAKA